MNPENMVSVDGAAKILNTHRDTVQACLDQGLFTQIMFGPFPALKLSEVLAYRDGGGTLHAKLDSVENSETGCF